MNWLFFIEKTRNAKRLLARAWDRIFKWLCSLLAVTGVPCLPIFLEMLKTGSVAQETYFLTSIILSATYFFGAEIWFYRFGYGAFFSVNALFDTVPKSSPLETMAHHGGALLIGVALLHASERFGWHVFEDRPFPDNIGNHAHG
jgi:hypothetical protein